MMCNASASGRVAKAEIPIVDALDTKHVEEQVGHPSPTWPKIGSVPLRLGFSTDLELVTVALSQNGRPQERTCFFSCSATGKPSDSKPHDHLNVRLSISCYSFLKEYAANYGEL